MPDKRVGSVRTAARARRRADDRYVAAVLEAAAAGLTRREIAAAAGVSHQAITQLVARHKRVGA